MNTTIAAISRPTTFKFVLFISFLLFVCLEFLPIIIPGRHCSKGDTANHRGDEWQPRKDWCAGHVFVEAGVLRQEADVGADVNAVAYNVLAKDRPASMVFISLDL
jgi:hypothetical protein